MFISRDTRYRSPFGAVEQGCEVTFRICLPREWACTAAWFVHREESTAQWDGMFWAEKEGNDREWWVCRYTPPRAGIYWYRFAIDTKCGRRFLVCQPDSSATLSQDEGAEWQLTCYEKDFTTPEWLVGGLMYQVFPDRFAKAGTPETEVPTDRVLRTDWGGQPQWRADADGVVRNNDFFGGNLQGIQKALPHLKRLGVTCLYLNPIFEAHSNHRYDTANYGKIDPLLGTEEDFKQLTAAASGLGIRVMLDGVFSHTGADSVYFNKKGRYKAIGACQSPESPYASWYQFSKWPMEYAAWWGYDTLPEVDELNPSFLEYILGKEGIARKWLKAGAAGWRLDVADELPDEFLERLRTAVKETDSEAIILGEVWEDASNNKDSYGNLRRFLLGKELDSVMNYPFRQAIIHYFCGGSATNFFNMIESVLENYPPQVVRVLMNSLGTHDTERILTVLAGEPLNGRDRDWQAATKLSPEQRKRGITLLKLAAMVQYTLPGVPSLYYGDEVGLEGYRDPFNRGCFLWEEQNSELVSWFERLGAVRASCTALREGTFCPIYKEGRVVVFERRMSEEVLCCAVNPTEERVQVQLKPENWEKRIGDGEIDGQNLYLNPFSGVILVTNFPK